MSEDTAPAIEDSTVPITLEDLAERLDILGQQMNWLCENLQSMFVFMQQVGQNGGGIRGLMQAMKQVKPEAIDTGEANE